jgi:hypothetical protein
MILEDQHHWPNDQHPKAISSPILDSCEGLHKSIKRWTPVNKIRSHLDDNKIPKIFISGQGALDSESKGVGVIARWACISRSDVTLFNREIVVNDC